MPGHPERFLAMLLCAGLCAACGSVIERKQAALEKSQRVDVYAQLAEGYLYRNQLEAAQQEIERALALDDNHAQANHMMAILQEKLKRDDLAERHFLRAVSRSKPPEASNNFGVFLCKRDRLDEAERQFRNALAQPYYKTPDAAAVNAGVCRLKAGDTRGANAHFRLALQHNPANPRALLGLARIEWQAGRPLAARGFITRYFEVSTESPESLSLAADIEAAQGDERAARGFISRLRSRYPDSDEARKLGLPK